MRRGACIAFLLAVAGLGLGAGQVPGQANVETKAVQPPGAEAQPPSAAAEPPVSLAPMKKAATEAQIREYLRISGDVETYRQRWIAVVDGMRSTGKPYWPEAFWKSVEDEMRNTDLTPTFVMILQHSISKKLMKSVLSACHKRSVEQCRATPAYAEFYQAEQTVSGDVDRMQQARTNAIIRKVFEEYKPEINAARVKYMAEHPDWNGQ